MAGQAPEYQQRTVASGGGGPALLQGAPNADAGLSDALQRTGAQIGALGQQIHANRVETDGQTATKTASEFAAWSAEQVSSLERTPSAELPAAVQKYREEAQAFRQKAISNLRTREGAQYQGRLLDSYDAHAAERIGQITAFTADQDKLQGLDATVSNSAAAVAKAPELFGTTLAQTLAGIDQSGLTVEARAKLAVHARDTLAISATTGLMQKDIQGAAKELGPDGGKLAATRELDPKLREQLFQRATIEAGHARVAQIAAPIMSAMSADTRQGTAALLALEADKSVSEEDKLSVREAVRTQTNLLQDERARQYGEQLASVSRRLEAKTANSSDLAMLTTMYRRSALTEAQYASYTSRYEGMLMERAKGQAAAADLDALLTSGTVLSPHNSDHVKAVDEGYEHRMAGLPLQDPRRHTVALALANQTRILPRAEVDYLTGAARSPNAKTALLAAQMYGSLKDQAPDSLSRLDDHTRMFLGLMSGNLEKQVPPEQAYDAARALVFDVPKGVQDLREASWKEGKSSPLSQQPAALNDFISKDFKAGWFHSDPVPTTALLSLFNERTEELYKISGNLDEARKSAWTDLKRVYGVTKVNGASTVDVMPIENFGVKPEEVRADIAAHLSGTSVAEAMKAANAQRVQLAAPQEAAYRAWLDHIGMTKAKGFNVDSSYTGTDYDLRGFFQKYGPAEVNTAKGQHMTDEFKLPNHKTFSVESKFATGAARALAGSWQGDNYVPPSKTGDIKPEDVLVVANSHTLQQMNDMMHGKPVMPEYALWAHGHRLYKDGIPQTYRIPDSEEYRQHYFESQRKAEAEGQMQINQARDYRQALEDLTVFQTTEGP